MSAFFLFIFFVYGGVHVYVFLRSRSIFGFGWAAGIVLALFMLAMIFGVGLIRTLELYEYERTARFLACVVYLWMAVLFIFFCVSLVLDIVNLVLLVSGWILRTDLTQVMVAPRASFFVSLGIALTVCIYGYFEAQTIRTERVRIETSKLPPGIDRLTIAQISDVHLGLIIRCDRLARMLAVVNEAKPDMLVSSGDLVDAQINHLTGLADLLRAVTPRYGKYAITGNHEYFAGIEKAVEFTETCGFRMLRNEAVTDGPINIVGVNDPTGVRLGLERPANERALLGVLPRSKFTLFLKHQPRIERASLGLFDLMISGHTHKGQIFPFTLITRIPFPLNAGDYDLGQGSRLHVSRGTGTWGPPIRFLAPPEVTVYELVRKVQS
ncbi:MAG TPA: metallophosphoesterase [Nitrospirota bacterium]|nr:metallophosphoesterase [Nitrospirota bacterium]